jgi:hypothetical protein
MFSSKFLFKDFKNGRKGEVPASSIKGNQNIFNSFDSQGLPEDYQADTGLLAKLQKQVPLFNRPKAEKNIPDKRFPNCKSKEGIFILHSFFGIKKEFLNGQRSHLKPPSRDLARTVYKAENLNLHIFSAMI